MSVHGNILERADRGPFSNKKGMETKINIAHKRNSSRKDIWDYTKDYLCWSEERRFHKEKDTLQILFASCSTQSNIKLTLQVQKMSTNIKSTYMCIILWSFSCL